MAGGRPPGPLPPGRWPPQTVDEHWRLQAHQTQEEKELAQAYQAKMRALKEKHMSQQLSFWAAHAHENRNHSTIGFGTNRAMNLLPAQEQERRGTTAQHCGMENAGANVAKVPAMVTTSIATTLFRNHEEQSISSRPATFITGPDQNVGSHQATLKVTQQRQGSAWRPTTPVLNRQQHSVNRPVTHPMAAANNHTKPDTTSQQLFKGGNGQPEPCSTSDNSVGSTPGPPQISKGPSATPTQSQPTVTTTIPLKENGKRRGPKSKPKPECISLLSDDEDSAPTANNFEAQPNLQPSIALSKALHAVTPYLVKEESQEETNSSPRRTTPKKKKKLLQVDQRPELGNDFLRAQRNDRSSILRDPAPLPRDPNLLSLQQQQKDGGFVNGILQNRRSQSWTPGLGKIFEQPDKDAMDLDAESSDEDKPLVPLLRKKNGLSKIPKRPDEDAVDQVSSDDEPLLPRSKAKQAIAVPPVTGDRAGVIVRHFDDGGPDLIAGEETPSYAGKWWFHDATQLAEMPATLRAKVTHVTRIMETDAGEELKGDLRCRRCIDYDHECWVYGQDASDRICRPGAKCARCRLLDSKRQCNFDHDIAGSRPKQTATNATTEPQPSTNYRTENAADLSQSRGPSHGAVGLGGEVQDGPVPSPNSVNASETSSAFFTGFKKPSLPASRPVDHTSTPSSKNTNSGRAREATVASQVSTHTLAKSSLAAVKKRRNEREAERKTQPSVTSARKRKKIVDVSSAESEEDSASDYEPSPPTSPEPTEKSPTQKQEQRPVAKKAKAANGFNFARTISKSRNPYGFKSLPLTSLKPKPKPNPTGLTTPPASQFLQPHQCNRGPKTPTSATTQAGGLQTPPFTPPSKKPAQQPNTSFVPTDGRGRRAKIAANNKIDEYNELTKAFDNEEQIRAAAEKEARMKSASTTTGTGNLGSRLRSMSITPVPPGTRRGGSVYSSSDWTRDRFQGDRHLAKSSVGTMGGGAESDGEPDGSQYKVVGGVIVPRGTGEMDRAGGDESMDDYV